MQQRPPLIQQKGVDIISAKADSAVSIHDRTWHCGAYRAGLSYTAAYGLAIESGTVKLFSSLVIK
jgi:hypothetical protein